MSAIRVGRIRTRWRRWEHNHQDHLAAVAMVIGVIVALAVIVAYGPQQP